MALKEREKRIGQLVRLNAGHAKMVIVGFEPEPGVTNGIAIAAYAKTIDPMILVGRWAAQSDTHTLSLKRRRPEEFTAWDGDKTEDTETIHEDEEEMNAPKKDTLFKIPAGFPEGGQSGSKKDRYGKFVSLDGKKLVLSIDGGGYEAFHPDDVEEVMPWTFSAVVVGQNDHGRAHECHYSFAEGKVDPGDLLLSESGNFYRVKEVDTKYRNPKKEFKGSRVAALEALEA